MQNPLDRPLGWFDRYQQRYRPTAFVVAVLRRASDDQTGTLAALVTFYGFLSVFPLLLLFFTIVSKTLNAHPALQDRLIHAALSQFPDLGDKLRSQISTLSANSTLLLTVTSLGVLWGALGIANSLQYASNVIWRVPPAERPGIWPRIGRSIEILMILGLLIVASSALTALSAAGLATWGHLAFWLRSLTLVAGAALNVVGYLAAFGVLTPRGRPIRSLVPGALVGGVGWTGLQYLGGTLVSHHLHRAGTLYGIFAVVLGLIFWINLGTQLFLYANEINVVRLERLWPRSIFANDAAQAQVLGS